VKYQQSLTHTLSLDEIRHRQLPSFYIHNRHFRQLDRSMESICSGSAEPSIRLAYVLAGQLLKFCGHAICYNAPTLNNSQNLNLDFLAASFWVQWTWAHGSAGKCLISGGNNDLCKLGEEYSNASTYKFVVYSLQHSETFDVSHVFLPLTIAELSQFKQVRFFWPTLYINYCTK